jgi:protein-L-isoaspartate(D-aspartate) O-methyltransferase
MQKPRTDTISTGQRRTGAATACSARALGRLPRLAASNDVRTQSPTRRATGPSIPKSFARAGHSGQTVANGGGRDHDGPVTNAGRKEAADRLVRAIEASTEIHEPRILEAFRRVPRERFVPEDLADFAYEDRALPIGEGQTISQPSMIALMLSALAPRATDRALEVGAGCGYAAALLGELCESVEGVEIRPELAERAAHTLSELEIGNVRVRLGNGALGVPDEAPFDIILVSAGARLAPPELVEELGPGGRIAIPVGDRAGQHLFLGRREPSGALHWERRTPCVFVPFVNELPSAARS